MLIAFAAGAWGSAAAGAEPLPHAATAEAGPPVALSAAFNPKRLGAATAISFAIAIEPSTRAVPVALQEMQVSYPANLGLLTNGLGLRTCEPIALEKRGAEACPPNSKMGQGNALVEVPFGPRILHERLALGIYASPSNDGYVHLAILAHGSEPVIARIVLAAVLLPGHMKITIPAVVTLPGAPYATLVRMQATIGGALTYYDRVHGHTVAYRPRGIGLPDACPSGGWKLGASLAFIDGQRSRAATVIPCPRASGTSRG
jgi:hypothetical protein